MPDEVKEGQIGSGQGPEPTESGSDKGQGSNAPEVIEGQADDTGSPQTGEEQGVAGLPEGMTLETLPSAYKSLQGEYTKNQTAMKAIEKSLEPYGGQEQMLKWAQYLANNQSFAKWAQSEQQKQVLGTQNDPNSEVDEDTQKAIETVKRIANQQADRMYQDKIAPIENKLKQETLESNMSKMDADPAYSDWREYQDKMADIAETLPESMQDNPSYEDLQNLYWMAVRKAGKMDEVMAKSYEKILKAKQSKSTERPAPQSSQGALKKAMSITEAYQQAKRGAG